jgi:integrase
MFALEQDLDGIDLDLLEMQGAAWLNRLRRTIPTKTTGRRLTSLKALGKAYKLLVLVDYKAPTPARADPHPLPGGSEDLARMIDCSDTDEHKLLITLCGLVGSRVSEARSARPTDIDYAQRKLRIYGKGGRERIVPISDAAWEVILPIAVACMADPTSPMIKMGDRSARDVITRIGARAGVSRRVSSHDLRATFATLAYRKTRDIRAVQELLGHASSKQTEVYIEVDNASMANAANFME